MLWIGLEPFFEDTTNPFSFSARGPEVLQPIIIFISRLSKAGEGNKLNGFGLLFGWLATMASVTRTFWIPCLCLFLSPLNIFPHSKFTYSLYLILSLFLASQSLSPSAFWELLRDLVVQSRGCRVKVMLERVITNERQKKIRKNLTPFPVFYSSLSRSALSRGLSLTSVTFCESSLVWLCRHLPWPL